MKEIERDFIVTAKMKFSGMLPNMVIKDHIESKIRNKIENTCNDIVLDGEYYGNYNMEWQIFLEGDVDINTMEYNITFREEPFCEHCGERYTDFGIEIEDQGTTWCLDCFYSNGHLSDKQYNELSIKERKLRKNYLQKEINKLNDELNDDELDEGDPTIYNL